MLLPEKIGPYDPYVPSKPEFYDSMNLISEIVNKNIINHNTSQSYLGEAFFIHLPSWELMTLMEVPHGKLKWYNQQTVQLKMAVRV